MVNKCYQKNKEEKEKKHQYPRDRNNFLEYSSTKFKKYFNT